MSTLKSSAEDLTLNADGSGNDIKFQSNGSEVGSLTAEGVLTATSFAGSGASLTGVNAVNTGRKNLIINGAMNVYQRGTADIVDSTATFSLDRWYCYLKGGALATVTQDTDVPAGQGFGFSHKIDITTGDALGTSNDLTRFTYKIEAQDLQHLEYGHAKAKTMTLSFWIKSTITGTYIANFYQKDSAGDRILSKSYTVDSADTWEKKTITIEGDASGTINNDNGDGFALQFCLGSGSNYTGGTLATSWQNYDATDQFTDQVNAVSSASNNIYFTGVQLEVGSVATDFEYRSYGEELALCQRYYQKIDYKHAWGTGVGKIRSAGQALTVVHFLTVMRDVPSTITIPTIGQSSGNITYLNGEGYPTTHGSLSATNATANMCSFNFTGFSAIGSNDNVTWAYVTGGSAIFTFSAEL